MLGWLAGRYGRTTAKQGCEAGRECLGRQGGRAKRKIRGLVSRKGR